MMTASARFGQNVVTARKEKGLSQESLAKLAGIDRSYLSRVERGAMRVTLDKAVDIAKALETNLSELI